MVCWKVLPSYSYLKGRRWVVLKKLEKMNLILVFSFILRFALFNAFPTCKKWFLLKVLHEEGGQALIMAARNLRAIYAQSTRTSTVAVAFLGFFFGCAHTARRPNSSPLRTDVGAHSSPTCAHLRAVYAQSARTFTDSFRLHRLRAETSPNGFSAYLTDLWRCNQT